MRCPSCDSGNTKVIDSRHLSDGHMIRRRRECLTCLKRYTTYEKVQLEMPVIVKNDKRREPYNREKILKGVNKAEAPAKQIGEITMLKMYMLDPVAYVRFASFYWNFKDINGFVDSLQKSIGKMDEEIRNEQTSL